ncbi:MAG: hybrid sensor histidine kinase/response regulator, partial [Pseudomonadota bacterium]
RRRGDRVEAGVWDTGPGIAEADQDLIFEEFRRLVNDRQAPGLGLGLAIAERMARLLDHPLKLKSREGYGTGLSVCLPRVEPERQPHSDPTDAGHRAAGRVLVVDNEAKMLDSLATLFETWGYRVSAAQTPTELDTAWTEGSPDLLVIDFHLDDGLTGLDLIRELRQSGRTCPTIMISADHAADVRQAARAAGCEFLHKPIRPLALKSLVRRLAWSV